jgi:hypothetical protein
MLPGEMSYMVYHVVVEYATTGKERILLDNVVWWQDNVGGVKNHDKC